MEDNAKLQEEALRSEEIISILIGIFIKLIKINIPGERCLEHPKR